ncbi:MAG: threonine synthase [Proteobacteria bacterium]|nr:threonine synthase [Pseudomonadota bacterium]
MKLYNLKHPREQVNFKEAVLRGLGTDGGLYYPASLPYFNDIEAMLSLDFVSRSCLVMQHLLKDEFTSDKIDLLVKNSFNFPILTKKIAQNVFALELFWGPSLAFKDFGARFMANIMNEITKEPMMIVTATSGDTGAAIAHAFKDLPNIQVAILYPYQRISPLQEKLFCTLGGNIHTFAVQGNFDDCLMLVKQCFNDKMLDLNVNSGNSINISRILAQTLYYFEACATRQNQEVVICVPSGNFGNLTAGLLARLMGLPIAFFVAATNANDTVPRYLNSGIWAPHATVATLSNAMDVSKPNNWPRILELFSKENWNINQVICSIAFSDVETRQAMLALHRLDYIADPHSAIAYAGLKSYLKPNQHGVFLCTAHPAKFYESVQEILDIKISLPKPLQEVLNKKNLSQTIPKDYNSLKEELLRISK